MPLCLFGKGHTCPHMASFRSVSIHGMRPRPLWWAELSTWLERISAARQGSVESGECGFVSQPSLLEPEPGAHSRSPGFLVCRVGLPWGCPEGPEDHRAPFSLTHSPPLPELPMEVPLISISGGMDKTQRSLPLQEERNNMGQMQQDREGIQPRF